ncbi:hypothetical protein JKP88DRAFT_243492 [Tribonema minus]|uniref:Uncharacterized protein n=1 Tax=Tribonema minus TaxID=303371 RepID=A0A835Z8N7_9STRA|nr:hypothetical protein JKP88DRAFT_243492 [Tribonema minus]
MGGAASVEKRTKVWRTFLERGSKLSRQLKQVFDTLQLDDESIAKVFGIYAACSPGLDGLVSWATFNQSLVLSDHPFLERCFATFQVVKGAEGGLTSLELLVGIYRICTSSKDAVVNTIFECYCAPGDEEKDPMLHGADLKAMMKELHALSAEEKAQDKGGAKRRHKEMVDLCTLRTRQRQYRQNVYAPPHRLRQRCAMRCRQHIPTPSHRPPTKVHNARPSADPGPLLQRPIINQSARRAPLGSQLTILQRSDHLSLLERLMTNQSAHCAWLIANQSAHTARAPRQTVRLLQRPLTNRSASCAQSPSNQNAHCARPLTNQSAHTARAPRQTLGLLERLPNGVPATAAEFTQALNGAGGMEPVQPALRLVDELRAATCGSLFWEMEQRHLVEVLHARAAPSLEHLLLMGPVGQPRPGDAPVAAKQHRKHGWEEPQQQLPAPTSEPLQTTQDPTSQREAAASEYDEDYYGQQQQLEEDPQLQLLPEAAAPALHRPSADAHAAAAAAAGGGVWRAVGTIARATAAGRRRASAERAAAAAAARAALLPRMCRDAKRPTREEEEAVLLVLRARAAAARVRRDYGLPAARGGGRR